MSDSATKFAPTVPAAVRRQAELADEAVRQLQAEAEGTKSDVPGGVDGASSPSQTPPDSARPPGSPQDGVAAGPAPSHTQDASTSSDGWEQRYRTLKGKYDTEVPGLQNEVRSMQRSLEEMRLQISHPPPAPPTTVIKSAPIPEEDIEAYGSELVESARRWARAELMPEIEQLRHDVVRANGTAQNVQSQAAMQSVYNFMDSNLPDWNAVNTDPRFIGWLRGTDELSGNVRQDMLSAAFMSGDARRTLSFFRAFQSEHTEDYPQANASHTQYASNGSAGQVRLEDMAGPGRGAPVSPGAPASKRFFTQKDIADFYSAVTKGRFNGREAEKNRLEQELHDAVYEGRVRN